ncbi:hypothetical protein WN48_04244 [Eufriesea mexicana]|uniref:Uncharacterized protein n=1 Tax=Eufriesea mexicana TaxID=516756 RepID=A0A310S752_9HYME|nr:hypothetical protein WN48_04244 [Eufriesea mexicana]
MVGQSARALSCRSGWQIGHWTPGGVGSDVTCGVTAEGEMVGPILREETGPAVRGSYRRSGPCPVLFLMLSHASFINWLPGSKPDSRVRLLTTVPPPLFRVLEKRERWPATCVGFRASSELSVEWLPKRTTTTAMPPRKPRSKKDPRDAKERDRARILTPVLLTKIGPLGTLIQNLVAS